MPRARMWRGIVGTLIFCWLAGGESFAAAGKKQVSPELAQRAVALLKTTAKSPDFWPAMHACEALTQAGEREFVQSLLHGKLDTERDRQKQCGLARELVRSGDRAFVAQLLEILADKQANGRIHAAESLFKIGEVGDGRLLRAALEEREDGLVMMSAAALARCGNRAALGPVRTRLQHEKSETRMIAAWVLGQVGDLSDISALRKLEQLETALVARSFITNALARLGDAPAIEGVGKNLSHTDADVRTYAADTLAGLRLPQYLPIFTRLLEDDHVDARVRGAQAILLLDRTAETPPTDIQVTVFEATAEHPRYSEGSIVPLRDGRLLFAISEFNKHGGDSSPAQISARVSRDQGRHWDPPFVLQPNIGKQNVMDVTLCRLDPRRPLSGPLGMFYLVQNSGADAYMELRISLDEGKTFGDRQSLTKPGGYWFANNDRVLLLTTGRLVVPVAGTPDQNQQDHYRSKTYFSDDQGRTWRAGKGEVDLPQRGAMEPEVVELKDGRLLLLLRTQLGQIYAAHSPDGGDTWSDPQPWNVRSPEAPATCRRIPATGDLLLIWNDNYEPGKDHLGKRRPLTAAVSQDEGKTWKHRRRLEDRADQSYAYTSLIFDRDRALVSYYVGDDKTGSLSTRFRSLSLSWFYSDEH